MLLSKKYRTNQIIQKLKDIEKVYFGKDIPQYVRENMDIVKN